MAGRTFSVHAATIRGVEAVPVTVEVSTSGGIPGITFAGMADTMVRESSARVRSAIKHYDYTTPRLHVTVNLAPAEIHKTGTGFDLPIAVAILACTGQVPTAGLDSCLFAGELALDGSVCPVRGAAAYERLARESGLTLVGPPDASFCVGEGGRALADIGLLRAGVTDLPRCSHRAPDADEDDVLALDFADVIDQEIAKRACLVAAAGGHGMLMVGPPGSGKTMLAKRLPTILPPLTREERDEALLVHSVAGRPVEPILRGERPFRAPHHSISRGGLIGGGRPVMPGEVTLAHKGVLFLDELPEFATGTLQALRQPIEEKEVRLVRVDGVYRFPCDFQLIAAANPCPCGHLGDEGHECTCSPARIAAYQARIGGPLMDRIDVVVDVARPSAERIIRGSRGMGSAEMRERVVEARERAEKRGLPAWGRVTVGELAFSCKATATLQSMAERLVLGGRAITHVARVARTIADVEGHGEVTADDVMEACAYRARTGGSK